MLLFYPIGVRLYFELLRTPGAFRYGFAYLKAPAKAPRRNDILRGGKPTIRSRRRSCVLFRGTVVENVKFWLSSQIACVFFFLRRLPILPWFFALCRFSDFPIPISWRAIGPHYLSVHVCKRMLKEKLLLQRPLLQRSKLGIATRTC